METTVRVSGRPGADGAVSSEEHHSGDRQWSWPWLRKRGTVAIPDPDTVAGHSSRGTRLLVTATAAWIAFLFLLVLLVDRWWPWFIWEAIPPLALVMVPLVLLALVPFARQMRGRLSVVLVLVLLSGIQTAGYAPAWPDT